MTPERAPFPTDPIEFGSDSRISFSQTSNTHLLEDEGGKEWEWLARPGRWVPVTDEALVEQQAQVYRREGDEESVPAPEARKRKAADVDGKSSKKAKPTEPKKTTAIYVTSLPKDVDEEEIYTTFSRYGVIAESLDTSKPRIKLYYDDQGKFKGDALIVYFRPESVQLAIDMLDESDFRLGQRVATGPMRVKVADQSYKSQKEQPQPNEEVKKKGTTANRDRQKAIKKTQEMNSRLADWDDDDPQTQPDTSSRWDKVVVMKRMFTLAELEEDPAALLDIKEDVRDECATLGTVTNVVLYDHEPDGVMTVRFADAAAARACVAAFDGRWFTGRQIEVYIADGSERFRKAPRHPLDDDPAAEAARLERFAQAIESEHA